ncbi:MAG: carbohydrate porin [Thiohalocapsa sp.]
MPGSLLYWRFRGPCCGLALMAVTAVAEGREVPPTDTDRGTRVGGPAIAAPSDAYIGWRMLRMRGLRDTIRSPDVTRNIDGTPIARPARWLDSDSELGDHGITLDIDAALYDQWASETTTGDDNLGTFAWQASGNWPLLRHDRWGSGSVGWTFLGSQGLNYETDDETLSSNVGSISGLNANLVPNAVAVDEVFWRHLSTDRRWTLLAGRIDQSAYFDANRVANDGYSQFIAFAFENNPSIPWSTYGDFGGLLRFDPGPDLYLMASVAAAGNDQPRVAWSSGGRSAWNQMIEIGITRRLPGLGRGHYRLTPWHNKTGGAGGFGVAFNLDQELGNLQRRRLAACGQPIGFFRAGIGDPDVTPVERFISGGLSVANPFGRSGDQIAVGVGWSRPSPSAGERSETLVEAYYRIALTDSLALTPDLQLIIDPANNEGTSEVVVLGVRLQLQL